MGKLILNPVEAEKYFSRRLTNEERKEKILKQEKVNSRTHDMIQFYKGESFGEERLLGNSYPNEIQFAREGLKDNKEYLLKVLENENISFGSTRYPFLVHISERLQDDPEFVLKVLMAGEVATFYCSKRLEGDKEFLLELVETYAESEHKRFGAKSHE